MLELNHLASSLEKIEPLIEGLSFETRSDLFSISGQPHLEVVMSNWFNYFLESENEHGFTGLFAEAITKILKEKEPEIDLSWCNDQVHSRQEMMTNKRNFIDLVIYDAFDDEKEIYENALVIEHKVLADLYNDLEDYYDSVEVHGEKQGVVLSARTLEVNDDRFINITYPELIDSIQALLGRYSLDADLTNFNYLQDFINNMIRMSDSKPDESVAFCFEHGKTIESVVNLRSKAIDNMAESLRQTLASDKYYSFNRKYPYSFSLWGNEISCSIVLGLADVFELNTCSLQFWLYKESVLAWNKVPDHSLLKEMFGNQFTIREKKEGKDWVELVRGTINLEEVDGKQVKFETVIQNYLHAQINPLVNSVKEQIEKYST